MYNIEGITYPSVTEILSFGGSYDFSNVSRETLRRKAYIGTAVHKACELHDQGTLDESSVAEQIKGYVDAWKSFVKISKFKMTENEVVVVSKAHGYAGRLDSIGKINGLMCLVDIKTSVSISRAVGLQTEAYRLAYEEMTGKKLKNRYCVQLKKDGKFKIYALTREDDRKDFLHMLKKYKEDAKNGNISVDKQA